MKRACLLFLCFALASISFAQSQDLPNAPSAQEAALKTISKDPGWPRTFKNGAQEFVIHQPQVDKWDGNRIYLYAAIELKSGTKAPSNFGVVWFSARTEVDKINRLVTLDDGQVSKVHFPAAKSEDPKMLALLQARLPGKTKVISLDRLEAGIKAAEPDFQSVPVKNDPPQIIVSTKPSLLVIIDGQPKLVPVQSTNMERVVNTSAILLFDKDRYYLRVMDWWLEAKELAGPWERAKKLTDDMKKAEDYLVKQAQSQDSQQPADNKNTAAAKEDTAKKDSLKDDKHAAFPIVRVVNRPAELIDIDGEPVYSPIDGTNLQYVTNTNAAVFRQGEQIYALISGRWFTSNSLQGEWSFVDGKQLPADFARIPLDSPMAKILVSVPGTPQAQEALIANSIPQTATITRSEAKITVVYDGDPVFEPIEGTTMSYARNTSAAVIRVGDNKYYAVESGVWFVAATAQGPWLVATSVPEVIYTIPPSSPLYYVTYAKVYGSTPDVVYVGYTPGYYGTVVSSSTNTVVYGTGWYYTPYVSTVWYGYPYTYGVGAGFTWASSTGWSFGFGYGYTYYPYYPWWGPMGYYGAGWYPYYGWGAWGGAAVTNVYGRWGNTAYSRTAAGWANPYTGNYGAASRGAAYNSQTGRYSAGGRGYNTNIYTGNTVGYRGGATYNPNTGIVAGAGAGFAGNRYTGEGTAGRGGFVYNTNTGAGMVAGKNNIYAGKDGTVYRYDRSSGSWSQNSGSGWQSAQRPGGSGNSSLYGQQQARAQGSQRTQNFNSMRSSGSYSGYRGGGYSGGRMGGGRRR